MAVKNKKPKKAFFEQLDFVVYELIKPIKSKDMLSIKFIPQRIEKK